MRVPAHAIPLLLLAAACSSTPSPYVFSASPDAGLPECIAPGDLVPPSTPPAWVLGRAVVVCTNGSSGGTFCVSDDATCPSFAGTCTDACAADQFAVAYGGPGPSNGSPTPPLPPGCSPASGTGNFAGVIDVCCPCQ